MQQIGGRCGLELRILPTPQDSAGLGLSFAFDGLTVTGFLRQEWIGLSVNSIGSLL